MDKALVIVESPAKAKTINKYLGNSYVVKSSIGHIRDLPTGRSNRKKNIDLAEKKISKKDQLNKKVKKNKKIALVNRMGIDPYHDWQAQYEILPGKEKVVAELKSLAAKVNHIYLATDLDREGEAIAWHLREIIGGNNTRFSRVMFNEITQNAIGQAFKYPIELNIHRINAQQARRFMDRIVGYMISPLLWKKIAHGLSAGRVQSVALRLVVKRENNIKTFIPVEYWDLNVELLTQSGISVQMEVTHVQDCVFKPISAKQIHTAVTLLENAQYKVSEWKKKSIISKPNAPFITSTLQQTANTRLGFRVKKTMLIAQRLYEAGYITYMRTDSTNLSNDALAMVRNYIHANFGEYYLSSSINQYNNKKNSQEAHEAIRPSNINILATQLTDMEGDAQKLYKLIWCQFIACQMSAAIYDSTTLIVQALDYQLKAKGRTLRFDGWTKIIPTLNKSNKDCTLPVINIGSILYLKKLQPNQHFTKPPSRYNEASLVKELEKKGIGRPSTYATIISTIQERGYVRVHNNRFYAEKIGEIVTDRLEKNFHELMNYDFTARMENRLDQIANNQAKWKTVLDVFFSEFNAQLIEAEKDPEEGGMCPNSIVLTQIICPTCSRQMGIRTTSTGVFLGCSGYTLLPKERCKMTINLIPETEILNIQEGEYAETNALRARHRCQKCKTAMDSYLIDTEYKLHVCGNNPICEGYEIEKGKFHIKGYKGPIIKCEKCSADMHLKIGRFGKYIGCTGDKCKNTRKILRNGEVAPPKEAPILLPELPCEKSNAYFVLHDGAVGVFLSANTFPQSRETRAPRVEELVRFKHLLPEKLRYLADAPVKDKEGNKTLVHFSRKTKQQYILSEKAGKTTSWSAFYVNGKWIESKNK
ncbi:type I DNA topoisomerase [Candidatus Fukatsuia anoeciicola]|uniref:type I DNA topoisomerase n=1 Tax=Candidatus Fukatsuia anoeciicola TaxID=2994492 RepID=UPI003463B1C6